MGLTFNGVWRILRVALFALLLVAVPKLHAQQLHAQHPTLNAAEQAAIIERVGELMEAHYVFPDVAAEAAGHLMRRHEDGAFRDPTALDAFQVQRRGLSGIR